jgi:hypothetical protein
MMLLKQANWRTPLHKLLHDLRFCTSTLKSLYDTPIAIWADRCHSPIGARLSPCIFISSTGLEWKGRLLQPPLLLLTARPRAFRLNRRAELPPSTHSPHCEASVISPGRAFIPVRCAQPDMTTVSGLRPLHELRSLEMFAAITLFSDAISRLGPIGPKETIPQRRCP